MKITITTSLASKPRTVGAIENIPPGMECAVMLHLWASLHRWLESAGRTSDGHFIRVSADGETRAKEVIEALCQ